MEDRKEKVVPWLSVPQFGEWEQIKGDKMPDYSVDFSKIRENRRQHKRDLSRASIGNEEEELIIITKASSPTATSIATPTTSTSTNHFKSPTRRKSILSYFNCCVKA